MKEPKINPFPTLIPSIHRKCGTIVCYIDHLPHKGEIVKSASVTLPDGSQPNYGDRVVCPKCGKLPWGVNSLTVHPDYKEAYDKLNAERKI